MKENGKVLNKFTYSCCATDMEIHDESGALKYKIKSDTMQRKRFLFDQNDVLITGFLMQMRYAGGKNKKKIGCIITFPPNMKA